MISEKIGNITLYNADCMDVLPSIPDEYFQLAIIDPPYGIGKNWTKDKNSKFYKHKSSYDNNSIPDETYFKEIFRISKNQIIWGGNYFTNYLPARNSWIVWNKKRDYPTQHMAEGELAWTSFNIPLRIADFLWNGACVCEPRYGRHPHEKPILLYKWLLLNYAKPGDKIIDTHFGSLSIGLACHDLGFELTAVEKDKEYYESSKNRLKWHQKQLQIF